MPQSQRPRRAYKGPYSQRVSSAVLDASKDSTGTYRVPEQPHTALAVHRGPRASEFAGEALGSSVGNVAHDVLGHYGRRAGIVGAAAATGGVGIAVHRHRRSNVSKLYDPFTGTVVSFGKAMPSVAQLGAPAKVKFITARTAEGANVSHENDLQIYRGKSTSSRTNELRRYTANGEHGNKLVHVSKSVPAGVTSVVRRHPHAATATAFTGAAGAEATGWYYAGKRRALAGKPAITDKNGRPAGQIPYRRGYNKVSSK